MWLITALAIRSGIVICTWAPGNGRELLVERNVLVPARARSQCAPCRCGPTACRPSVRRNSRTPASPWPRPGSRKRLTPRITASSSAIASSQRSLRAGPARSRATGGSRRPRRTPRSRTTRRPSRFCQRVGLHGDPAAAARVLDDVLADLGERHREAHRRLRVEVQLLREDRLRLAAGCGPTTSWTSSLFAIGVISSSTSRLAAVARARHRARAARTARRRA